MLRITELEVHNVGPFEHAKFVFPEKTILDKAEIHVLTGKNGTGKTTVLMMLASAISKDLSFITKRIRLKTEDVNYWVSCSDDTIYEMYFNDQKPIIHHAPDSEAYDNSLIDHYSFLIDIENNGLRADEVRYNTAFFAYSGLRSAKSVSIYSIHEIENSPVENALNFETSINPQLLINWIANQKTKEALASMGGDKELAQSYTESLRRIEEAIFHIIDQRITFSLQTNPLKVTLTKEGVLLDFDVLPDGLKSIISWIADLLMRLDRMQWVDNTPILDRNFILFLDEIDVHLHPEWQRKILPVIQNLFKNAQIFISTHSPFVVGSADGVWIHRLESGGNNVVPLEPILSENSKSYQLILDEVFDIHERFGLEIEAKLKQFRELRTLILQKSATEHTEKAFLELVAFFQKEKSIELDNIIGGELRQLSRITGKNYLTPDVTL